MTILVIILALFFLMRRVILPSARSASNVSDFLLIVITALPFVSGYFLTHGTLDSVAFFEEHIMAIHILSGEVMIVIAVFLFCRTRLNTEKCVACTACEIICPTGTLESEDKENKRIFTYSHYQCICCGACVKTCPEAAAELRHEISPGRLLQVGLKQEIRSVDLTACERCGAFFAPEPQLDKIEKVFAHDYTRFCPRCRKVNIGEIYHQLSPWTKNPRINRSDKGM
jgi:Pyruvate/2-oxoacid:ferredoxin oxidoreductase delta subunit